MSLDTKAQRLKALAAYQLLKAKATAVLGSASADKQLLSVLAKAAILASRSSYESLEVAVSASLLHAVTTTGKYFILLEPVDFAITSEVRNVSMSRVTRDDFRALEQARISLAKSFADHATSSDRAVSFVRKAASDVFASTDSKVTLVGKSLHDETSALDQASLQSTKARQDSFATSDLVYSSFGKKSQDNAYTHDDLSRVVSYVRFFSDTTDATDSVSVVAVTDDGEVMHLGKSVDDYAASADHKDFYLAKALADATVSQDLWIKAYNKPRSDSFATSTHTDYSISRVSFDGASALERAIYSLAKLVVDFTLTTDYESRHFHKSVSDFVRTSDAHSFGVALGKFESLTASEVVDVVRIAASGVPPQIEHLHIDDVAAMLAHKFFHEELDATDDFLHEMTVDDDQTVTFKKNVPEVLHTVEQRSFSMQRGYAETLGANDSGVLFWTDYCDSTYFSQSFVGNERTFT